MSLSAIENWRRKVDQRKWADLGVLNQNWKLWAHCFKSLMGVLANSEGFSHCFEVLAECGPLAHMVVLSLSVAQTNIQGLVKHMTWIRLVDAQSVKAKVLDLVCAA